MSRRRILTEEMVTMRTKCNRMDLIKNLNLWGNDLEDISVLQYMPNLEVLSLSVNCVSSLADLKYCAKLSELYLRKNDIRDLAEVLNLRHLRQMRVLWLSDNPCAALPHYRQYVLHHLPGLTRLDSTDVTDGERHSAVEADLGSVQTRVAEPAYDEFEPIMETPDLPKHALSSSAVGPQRRASDPEFEDQHMFLADRSPQSAPARSSEFRQGDFYRDEPFRNGQSGTTEQQWHERSPAARSPTSASGASPPLQPRRQGNASAGSPVSSSFGFERAAPRSNGLPRGGAAAGRTYVAGSGHEQSPPQSQAWCEEGESAPAQPLTATDNILCAVLALIKELDGQGLELVKRAVEQRQEDSF